MRSICLTIIALLVGISSSFAQQPFDFNSYVPVSPKSPAAASLGQYVNVPVSLYTGLPEIEIPIYEIKVGEVTIPISLSYHASGVRVNDFPSWAGTGWALNAGGVISRSQRGIIDETMIRNYSSYQSYASTILSGPTPTNWTNSTQNLDNACSAMNSGSGINYDTESDTYSCSMPNNNFSFYMDETGNAHAMPANKINIQSQSPTGMIQDQDAFNYFPSATRNYNFQKWVVTDNNGIKYLFGTYTSGTATAYDFSAYQAYNGDQAGNINSWYLTEIDLPNGQQILFNYETYHYTQPLLPVYSKTIAYDASYPTVGDAIVNTTTNGFNLMVCQRLTSITFPNGKVEFVAGGYRADLPADKALDHVNIYNYNNASQAYSLLKSYKIFTNNPSGITQTDPDNSNTFRLNLDSVTMYDAANNRIGAYSMNYINNMPLARTALADYWGYYSNNVGPTISSGAGAFSLAASWVNPATAQFDLLSQIKYPTGGYSNFTFESNDAIPNDPNMLNTLEGAISIPGNKAGTYDLENTIGTMASGYGQDFTVGNLLPGEQAGTTGADVTMVTGQTCGNAPNTNTPECFDAVIYRKNADGTYTSLTELASGGTISLQSNTTYRIGIKWNTPNTAGHAYAYVHWNEYVPIAPGSSPVISVGGQRIKSIDSFDPVTASHIYRSYQYLNDAGVSSGSIAALPVYIYNIPRVMNQTGGVNYVFNNVPTYSTTNQTSSFNTPGTNVGYSMVTEFVDNNGVLGKNVYKYTSNDPTIPGGYPDANMAQSMQFPFPPAVSYEWRRGKLLSKYAYISKNGAYLTVSKTDNTYQFSGPTDINYLTRTNIKIVPNWFVIYGSSAPYYNSVTPYYYKYPIATEAFYTSSTTQQIFDSQSYSSSTTQETDNTLDPVSLQNSNTASPASNGNTDIKQFQYAANYSITNTVDNASLGIKNLITVNMVNAPVEELTILKNPAGQSLVTGGSLLIYYKDKPLVYQYYKLNLIAPVLLSSFTASYINSSGQFIYDSRYELRGSIDSYTTDFNASQTTKNNTVHTAYQWGYNDSYPVAQVSNAKSNDIYYDSFEEGDGNSTSGDSRTGHYSHTGTYSKALSGLDNGSYILSYWLKSGTTWTLQQTAATVSSGSYTISLSGQIDDVRFYPANAQMTTYTYDPLVGITSITDAKGEVTYYEYDGLQRLSNIKDKDGNIIKHIDYHYQNQ